MAYVLIIIGALLLLTGAKDTYKAFGTQLYNDFTGSGGFIYWLFLIGVVGAVGYYAPWRTFSRSLLGLIIVVYVVANKGLFAQIQKALSQGPVQPASNAPPLPDSVPLHLSGLGGSPIPIKLVGQGGMGGLGGGGGGGGLGGLGALGGLGLG